MILSLDEIRDKVQPIAKKYQLRAVYLFGSYARNEATDDSDVDLLIDRSGSSVKSMLDMGGLYNELNDCLGKRIDIITTLSLDQESTKKRTPDFIENLLSERIVIYE